MNHSERILEIIRGRGLTPYRVAKDTGIPQSVFSEWKRRPSSNIYSGNLVLIADYLGCSVDYLLGRTEDPVLHQQPGSVISAVDAISGLLVGMLPEDYDAKALREERTNDRTPE